MSLTPMTAAAPPPHAPRTHHHQVKQCGGVVRDRTFMFQESNSESSECRNSGEKSSETTEQPRFRSVLPHEPLPSEAKGYLVIQGSFEPRFDTINTDKEATNNTFGSIHDFWTKNELEEALLESLRNVELSNSQRSIQSVQLLDHAHPFTKARITVDSPQTAREIFSSWRSSKITPADLLSQYTQQSDVLIHFSTRPLQVTQLTTQPLLAPDVAWPRSNPPKFRRLLARPGEDLATLEKERASTRFVFITGLVDEEQDIPPCWNMPLLRFMPYGKS